MKITNFLSSDSGAVAVDWVVLSAALVGLGIATTAVVATGIEDLTGEMQVSLAVMDVQGFAVAGAVVALLDYSGYSLVGPQHSEGWRTSEQARFAAMDEAQLMADYQHSMNIARGGQWPHAQHETDRAGVMLSEMSRRGMPIPDDAGEYVTLHASMNGIPG